MGTGDGVRVVVGISNKTRRARRRVVFGGSAKLRCPQPQKAQVRVCAGNVRASSVRGRVAPVVQRQQTAGN